MDKTTIKVSKKERQKGDDGYKTFSVRIKEDTIKQLEDISKKTNRSRNELINLFLEYAVNNCELED